MVIDTECKGGESLCTCKHCGHLTDVFIGLVLFHLNDGFCLIVNLCSDMTSGILITLVLMEDCMDVNLIFIRPAHQYGSDLCSLQRSIDIKKKVTHSINDDKSDSLGSCKSTFYDFNAFFRSIFA